MFNHVIAPVAEALALARRGWPVFPLHHAIAGKCSCGDAVCTSVGKHPRTKNGFKDATIEPDRINKWWHRWPDANVGVATGATAGIVVIDVDPRHDGTESLALLEQEHGELPPTVESHTGGDGRHLVFAHPDDIVSNRSGVRPGIDVRGDGGYIVVPPSIHASGKRYCWREGRAPHEINPISLPAWLLRLIVEPTGTSPTLPIPAATPIMDDRYASCLQSLLKIKIGDQKDGSRRLFAAACRCVECDLSDTDALACIAAYTHAKPFPKAWSEEQVLARLRDAEKRTQRGKSTEPAPGNASSSGRRANYELPYEVTEHGTVWMKPTKDGAVAVPLMNFSARIVGEVLHDDGAEQRLVFEIEAKHKGLSQRFSESATRFAGMNWPTEHLGATAFLYPGLGTKDHARCAVQMLSGDVPRRTVYEHLGWREFDGQWAYLHTGGAIAATGSVLAMVEPPPSLQNYSLPEPPIGRELCDAVRASMAIIELAPTVVTVPVWLAAWRSVLAPADFSIFLCGETGGGKTELAALAQQHFGSNLDARHLPASWASTGNSLESLAFAAKDALLVVDDFAPGGTSADVARYHRDADRLLRAQGNQAGRGRLSSDGRLRPSKPPRGLVMATGEDIPRGHSIRARSLIVEMPPQGMDWSILTDCQHAAGAGVYASAMAGFLLWVAARRQEILDGRMQRIAELRADWQVGTGHKRTPGLIAELIWAAETFVQFAVEIGALSPKERVDLSELCRSALQKTGAAQADHQAASDPVVRFQELLSSAVASGRVHVATTDGGVPENPAAWGWRERVGVSRQHQIEWLPQGDRVGWIDNEDLLLDSDAAYRAVQQMCGDGMAIQPRTLWKRMDERGQLKHRDPPHFTTKRSITGTRRRVLSVGVGYIAPEVGRVGQVGPEVPIAEENGRCCPTSPPHSQPASELSGAENWGSSLGNAGENGAVPHSPHSL